MHLYLKNGISDPESLKETLLPTPVWFYYCAFFHLITYTELAFSAQSFLSPVSMKEQSLCPFSELYWPWFTFPLAEPSQHPSFPCPVWPSKVPCVWSFQDISSPPSFLGCPSCILARCSSTLLTFWWNRPFCHEAMQMVRNSQVVFLCLIDIILSLWNFLLFATLPSGALQKSVLSHMW